MKTELTNAACKNQLPIVLRNRYALGTPLRLVLGVLVHVVLAVVFVGFLLTVVAGGVLMVVDLLRGKVPTGEDAAQVVALGLMFLALSC